MDRFVKFGWVVLLAGLVYCVAHPTCMILFGTDYSDPLSELIPPFWGAAGTMGFAAMLGAITLNSPGPRIAKALKVAALVSAAGFGGISALVCTCQSAMENF